MSRYKKIMEEMLKKETTIKVLKGFGDGRLFNIGVKKYTKTVECTV